MLVIPTAANEAQNSVTDLSLKSLNGLSRITRAIPVTYCDTKIVCWPVVVLFVSLLLVKLRELKISCQSVLIFIMLTKPFKAMILNCFEEISNGKNYTHLVRKTSRVMFSYMGY